MMTYFRRRRTLTGQKSTKQGAVPYAANLMSVTPKSMWPAVKAMLHSVNDQPESDAAPTPSESSPTGTRSCAWSTRCWPSRPTNRPKGAAISGWRSSPRAACSWSTTHASTLTP